MIFQKNANQEDDTLTLQPSFRRQLTGIVTAGVLALTIITSLTTAWVTSTNLYSLQVSDGLRITENLADQSVLALLYGSGENAEDAVRIALGFPSVNGVMILNHDLRAILSRGSYAPSLKDVDWSGDDVRMAMEDLVNWMFVAPVYTPAQIQDEDHPILMPVEPPPRELLGYVVVTKSKEKLRQIQVLTIINNLGIGLLIAALLVFLLRMRFDRLTKPLNELSNVMARAEQGDKAANARVYGPKEVESIASAFNKMMEALAERDMQLRQHNEQLEHEVALRTQELVYARDMAVQANRNKSEFLANVTHELRTPLQSIIGYADLMLESLAEEDADDLRHDLECILSNSQNLLNMINEVLDFSKVESGMMDVNLASEDLQKIVSHVQDTVRRLMTENRNRLNVTLERFEHEIMIDGAKLRQIILNLVSNAGKFTQGGQVDLVLRHTPAELLVKVSDTGIGIDRDHQKIIFEPFRQVDGSLTRKYQGTGLGLAITKKFCQLMHGEIRVFSEPGKGAIFTVKIPLPVKRYRNEADSSS